MSSSSIGDANQNDHLQQQQNSNANHSQGTAITAFLAKLWALVNDASCDDLIAWDPTGTSFHVYDQSRFAREILPRYFKHNNFASFIRQLNMYGFRKMSTIEHGSLKNERDDIEFAHPSFIRGQDGLLESIKRRAPENQPKTQIPTIKTEMPATPLPPPSNVLPNPTSDPPTIRPVEFGQILTDVRNLKCKQSSLSDKLIHLEDENQALWREISILRQKHAKQQQIVSKLMEFLLHILTSSTQNHRRSVEPASSTSSGATSASHPTINLTSHSLKRKPAALMHSEPPTKRSTTRPTNDHLYPPSTTHLNGLTPPQCIIINELIENDTGLWPPNSAPIKNSSPLIDLVPSPPPSSSSTSSVQHRDETYSPNHTNYEWIGPAEDLINAVSTFPGTANAHEKNPSEFLPDFFLTSTDEPNSLTLHNENRDQNTFTSVETSRISPSKLSPNFKEEEIEFVNNFPSNNKTNSNPENSAGNVVLSLEEFADHVDHIQSSLDNIREYMFNKISDGTTIDDLFAEEHVLLSPLIPATSNLLTDPIHVEESKANEDFLYPDTSQISVNNAIPEINQQQYLEQFIRPTGKLDDRREKHLEYHSKRN